MIMLPPVKTRAIVWRRKADHNPGQSLAATVDSAAKSAHKCGIATLAEMHLQEVSVKSQSANRSDVFPVSFLVFSCQKSTNRLDTNVQQARAGLRSILPPAQSYE